jgi:3-hydroxyacyl-[acyl-carrier-protein] dehydratase
LTTPTDVPPVDLPPLDQILPHRYPFLLVDRIVSIEPGRRIVAVKQVSHSEPCLAPGQPPVMPPTMIVEAVAQVGAVLVLTMPEHRNKLAVVLGMERVRSRKRVQAGDTMEIEVTVQKLKASMGRMAGVVRVNGRLMATGVVTFAIVPRPVAD